MDIYTLSSVNPDYYGYSQIIMLYHSYRNAEFEQVQIKINQWFNASLCSCLGSILDLIQSNYNDVYFSFDDDRIRYTMQRNGFLPYYGYDKLSDGYNTTIGYKKLLPQDGKCFSEYVNDQLLSRNDYPEKSEFLKRRIHESISEIFSNAKLHSDTINIYVCGQCFKGKHQIVFTLTDTGIGIKERVNNTLGTNYDSIDAIKWAIKDRHTTKWGVPGGIGLSILTEYINENNGIFQIISDDGFYELKDQKEEFRKFDLPFPGTVVTLVFRMDDEDVRHFDDNDAFPY